MWIKPHMFQHFKIKNSEAFLPLHLHPLQCIDSHAKPRAVFSTCRPSALNVFSSQTWWAERYRAVSAGAAWLFSSPGTRGAMWTDPVWWSICLRHSTPPAPPEPHGYSAICKTETRQRLLSAEQISADVSRGNNSL